MELKISKKISKKMSFKGQLVRLILDEFYSDEF